MTKIEQEFQQKIDQSVTPDIYATLRSSVYWHPYNGDRVEYRKPFSLEDYPPIMDMEEAMSQTVPRYDALYEIVIGRHTQYDGNLVAFKRMTL